MSERRPSAPASTPGIGEQTTRSELRSPADTESAPAPLFDRFGTLSAVGQGAMGRVYRGHDVVRGIDVAIKMLVAFEPALAVRLRREALVLSRLDHPHLCSVLESGEHDGRPYLVMPYVEGRPLDEVLPGLGLVERLQIFRQICAGVEAAHSAGLIHRDLKPGNVLVRDHATAGLLACVMDFGIAHDRYDSALTATGEVLGTPAYMSPEQACGDSRYVDQRSDIWSLGAILFVMLCDRLPFPGRTASEVLARILDSDAPSPRSVDRRVPRALARICLQCLERDPERRYRSTAELAGDIDNYLAGRSVRARTIGLAFHLRRTWQRQPRLWAALGLLALALLASASYSLWLRVDARAQAQQAAELARVVESVQNRMRIAYLSPPAELEPIRRQLRDELAQLDRLRTRDAESRASIQRALAIAYAALGDDDDATLQYQALQDSGRARPLDELGIARVLIRRYADARRPFVDLPAAERDALLADHRRRLLDPAEQALQRAEHAGADVRIERLGIAILQSAPASAAAQLAALADQDVAAESLDRLRGDLQQTHGEQALASGDMPAARAAFAAARGHYAAVATILRGDPEPNSAACLSASAIVLSDRVAGTAPPPSPALADPHCAAILRLEPAGGRSLEAIATFWIAIARAHASRNELAQARTAQEQAAAFAERALAQEPKRLKARLVLAEARASAARAGVREYAPARAALDDAAAQYGQLLELAPTYLPARIGLAKILRNRGRLDLTYQHDPRPDYDAAAALLRQALAQQPDSVEALDALSLTEIYQFYYWRDHDHATAIAHAESAIAEAERILRLRPRHPDALYAQGANIGDLWVYRAYLAEAGQFADELPLLERALDLLAVLREAASDRPEGYGHAIGLLMTAAERSRQLGLSTTHLLEQAEPLMRQARSRNIQLDNSVEGWLLNERAIDLATRRSPGAQQAFDQAEHWLISQVRARDEVLRYTGRRMQVIWATAKAEWLRGTGQDAAATLATGVQALAAAEEFEIARDDPIALCAGADLHWQRAEFLGPQTAEGQAAQRQCLDLLERCTADDPTSARPWVARRDRLRSTLAQPVKDAPAP